MVCSSIVYNSVTVQFASKIHCLFKWLILWQNYSIDLIEQERPVEEADIAVKISSPGFSSQTVVEGRHRSNLVLDIFLYDYIDCHVIYDVGRHMVTIHQLMCLEISLTSTSFFSFSP